MKRGWMCRPKDVQERVGKDDAHQWRRGLACVHQVRKVCSGRNGKFPMDGLQGVPMERNVRVDWLRGARWRIAAGTANGR